MWLRLYEFACCFLNVSRCSAALSVSALPSQLSQRESQGRPFDTFLKNRICSTIEKIVNCQLSIVNSNITVNCHLISPNASISRPFSSGSFTATRYQPSPRPG